MQVGGGTPGGGEVIKSVLWGCMCVSLSLKFGQIETNCSEHGEEKTSPLFSPSLSFFFPLRCSSSGRGGVASGLSESSCWFVTPISSVSNGEPSCGRVESGRVGVGFQRLQMYLLSHQHNATADEKRVQRRTQDGMAAFIPRWLKMRAQRLGQGMSGDWISAASRYRLRPAPPGYHTLPSVEIFKAQGFRPELQRRQREGSRVSVSTSQGM